MTLEKNKVYVDFEMKDKMSFQQRYGEETIYGKEITGVFLIYSNIKPFNDKIIQQSISL